MIVAAFIIAMLITPSPEITTQFTLAAPTILMYQIGILLVWLRHRQQKPKKVSAETLEQKLVEEVTVRPIEPTPEQPSTPVVAVAPPKPRPAGITPGRVDVLMRYKPAHARNTTVAVPPRQKPQDILASQVQPQVRRNSTPRVSIDGFFPASDT